MLELIKCRFRKSDCFIFGNRYDPAGICGIADLLERLIFYTEKSGFIGSFVGEIFSVFLQVFFARKLGRFHSVFSVWSAEFFLPVFLFYVSFFSVFCFFPVIFFPVRITEFKIAALFRQISVHFEFIKKVRVKLVRSISLKIYRSSHEEFREGSVIIRNQIKKLVRTSFHGNIIRHIERPDNDKKDRKCGEHGNPYELSSKLLNHV